MARRIWADMGDVHMSAGMTAGEITRRPARVVIADDEALFRASLRQLLAVPPSVLNDVYGVDVGTGFDVVGEAGSGAETVQVVRSVNPDLLLLDLQMPRMTGLEALCDLAARHATPPTILLAGAIERPHLLNAVRLGVRGLVLKEFTAELLFEAIMCVLAGQYWLGPTLVTDFMESVRPLIQPAPVAVPGGAALTRREREVIARVVSGCANKEIALRILGERGNRQASSHAHFRQGGCGEPRRARHARPDLRSRRCRGSLA